MRGVALAVVVVLLLVAPPGAAQTPPPDFCGAPLPYQADPGEVSKFRQSCTIQKLLADRSEEAMQKTLAEVSAAVEAAHAKAQTDALSEEKRNTKYWMDYALGLEGRYTPELAADLDAICAWHGTHNVPTARMCKIWNK
jgi:hypothetical protein